LEDCDDLLASIMSADGMQRMASYVATHPPQNVVQRRRIVSAFLDKFALPEKIDVELDFPGWTESRIDALSDSYDQDVSRIMAMDGVKVLVP
jgi:hypothetical protein